MLLQLGWFSFASATATYTTPSDIFSLLPLSTTAIASCAGLEDAFSKARTLFSRVAAQTGLDPLRQQNTTLKEAISVDFGLPLDGVDTNGTFIVRFHAQHTLRGAGGRGARTLLTPSPLPSTGTQTGLTSSAHSGLAL